MASTKIQKKTAAQQLANQIRSEGPKFDHLEGIANALIDPQGGAVLFPQRAPGKLGCCTFPLVVEVKSTLLMPMPNLGIIIKPDLQEPLAISRPAAVTESADWVMGAMQVVNGTRYLNGDFPCAVVGQWLNGYLAAPLVSTAGGPIQVGIGAFSSGSVWKVTVHGYDGVSWNSLGSINLGGGAGSSGIIATTWLSSFTHYAFGVFVEEGNPLDTMSFEYTFIPVSPTLLSCSASFSERIMDVFAPKWKNLMAVSKNMRIVACDLLVTYEGSTLENAGSISVGNVDDDFALEPDETFYSAMAELPFDKYRGRLAGEGGSPGGAHWHYVPTNESQLSGETTGIDIPKGIVGIDGLLHNQVIRVEAHFMVNFYSQDPSYLMSVPPAITGYSPLLQLMRLEVPLVSSNDTHKVVKSLKRGLGKMGSTATDPKVLKLLTMLVAAM